MSLINERLKILRNKLKLNQDEFAAELGMSRSGIAKIEIGDRGLSEQLTKAICRTWDVNYFWLRDGEGEMFLELPETVLDELIADYKLDEIDKRIIKMYLSFPEDVRQIIKENLFEIFVKDD